MSLLKSSPSLTLFRGFRVQNEYVWSPFVNKLEARLRFDGLPYKAEAGAIPSAPRGKIPYMTISKTKIEEDGQHQHEAETIGDSGLIISKLMEDGLLSDLNGSLSVEDRVKDMALRALLEDKLYFFSVYERWHENYYTMRDGVLGFMPLPVRACIGLIAYRKVASFLHGQGTMRYTPDEIHAFRAEIWETINGLVVDSKTKKTTSQKDDVFWILGGSEPTEFDAVLFGFITSSAICKAAPETAKLVKSYPALLDYARRIHGKYFPEYKSFEE